MTNDKETFADQANRLVAENQHLRVKSDSDDLTIRLMREQYDGLAATVNNVRDKAAAEIKATQDYAEHEISDLTIERDQAVRAFKEIDTLLLQAADLVMQALRAREGDAAPESLPTQRGMHIDDDRLPIARLNA